MYTKLEFYLACKLYCHELASIPRSWMESKRINHFNYSPFPHFPKSVRPNTEIIRKINVLVLTTSVLINTRTKFKTLMTKLRLSLISAASSTHIACIAKQDNDKHYKRTWFIYRSLLCVRQQCIMLSYSQYWVDLLWLWLWYVVLTGVEEIQKERYKLKFIVV